MQGLTTLPVRRKPLCWRLSARMWQSISISISIAGGVAGNLTGKGEE
jgi:hypothetical protein